MRPLFVNFVRDEFDRPRMAVLVEVVACSRFEVQQTIRKACAVV